MHISDEFQRELRDEFDGRFRVRWSGKRDAYQVEYKVQPGQILEPPKDKLTLEFDTHDDDYIRARDGFDFIVEVRRGDRMPCPNCGLTVHLTPLQMKESTCLYCKARGRDGRVAAVFYPLNHVLIEHLRFIDPLRGGAIRVKDHVRTRQLAKEKQDFDDNLNQIDEVNKEFFPKFYGINTYAGAGNKVMPGSSGPGTK